MLKLKFIFPMVQLVLVMINKIVVIEYAKKEAIILDKIGEQCILN